MRRESVEGFLVSVVYICLFIYFFYQYKWVVIEKGELKNKSFTGKKLLNNEEGDNKQLEIGKLTIAEGKRAGGGRGGKRRGGYKEKLLEKGNLAIFGISRDVFFKL